MQSTHYTIYHAVIAIHSIENLIPPRGIGPLVASHLRAVACASSCYAMLQRLVCLRARMLRFQIWFHLRSSEIYVNRFVDRCLIGPHGSASSQHPLHSTCLRKMTHEEHEYEVYEMSAQASPIERHGTASPLQDTTGELPTPPSPCPADLIEPPLPADSHPPAPAPLSPPSSSQPALPLSVPSTPSAYPPAHPSAMPPKAGPSPLSRTDVQRDRILRTLALAKGIPLESPGPVAGPGPEAGRAFKARPAPAMGRPSGVGGAGGLVTAGGGPRLNKAAALRLGIKWEETGAARSSPVAVRGAAGPARTASIKGDAVSAVCSLREEGTSDQD